MQIEFYEEFPSENNLKKLKLIKFPTKIFIATENVNKFRKEEKIAKKYKKNLKVAYWPILKNSYWISPFSNTKDLEELFKDLSKIKNSLLIDLELPLNRKMMMRNFIHFFKNKKIIKNFLKKNENRITTAEYVSTSLGNIMKLCGLNYKLNYEKSLMWYSSVSDEKSNKKIKLQIKKRKNKEKFSLSLGTIAKGILGNEPILSPKNLQKDLEFAQEMKFEKVIIFRLGGLSKNYIKIINKFVNNQQRSHHAN